MNRIDVLAIAAVTVVSVGGAISVSAAVADHDSAPVLGGELPPGYRDWKLISVAREEGDLDDLRAILGNDVATEAYRAGKPSFPDGAIIARLAWRHVPSEENNRAFGRTQSYVAGPPTNIQFMVKDSRKYGSTGGWGFTQFTDGKVDAVDTQKCFSCHIPAKGNDFAFTTYAP